MQNLTPNREQPNYRSVEQELYMKARTFLLSQMPRTQDQPVSVNLCLCGPLSLWCMVYVLHLTGLWSVCYFTFWLLARSFVFPEIELRAELPLNRGGTHWLNLGMQWPGGWNYLIEASRAQYKGWLESGAHNALNYFRRPPGDGEDNGLSSHRSTDNLDSNEVFAASVCYLVWVWVRRYE